VPQKIRNCNSRLPLKVKGRAGGVAQVLEHLPSKSEALNSNPSTTKRKMKVGSKEKGIG
jgi:hypothetical protein